MGYQMEIDQSDKDPNDISAKNIAEDEWLPSRPLEVAVVHHVKCKKINERLTAGHRCVLHVSFLHMQ